MPFKRPLGERAVNQSAPTFIRPLQDRRVIVGQSVTLECQIDGYPDPVIKWLKDGQNVTQCPDYEMIQEGKKHALVIKCAQGADAGRFTIQAMNAAGIKQSTCMLIVGPAPTPIPGGSGSMSVAPSPGPPQTPVGPSAPFFIKELRHQPHKQGEKAVLEARVVGVPIPQVEWLKDGKSLNNYRLNVEYDPQTGICALTIPQMFNEDIGEYTIKAVNNLGTAQTSAQLLPKEQYDKWFSDEQRQVTKDRKQKMAQKYQPQQQQPPPQQYPYSYNRGPFSRSQPNSDSENAFSPVTIISESETEPELAGLNNRGTGPIIRTELRGLRLTEGTDAILQCNVMGNPKPRIAWLKNGIALNPAGPPRIQMNYKGSLAILKISMVTPDDSGEYTIVADNPYGKVQNSARIEVYPLNYPEARSQPSAPQPQPKSQPQSVQRPISPRSPTVAQSPPQIQETPAYFYSQPQKPKQPSHYQQPAVSPAYQEPARQPKPIYQQPPQQQVYQQQQQQKFAYQQPRPQQPQYQQPVPTYQQPQPVQQQQRPVYREPETYQQVFRQQQGFQLPLSVETEASRAVYRQPQQQQQSPQYAQQAQYYQQEQKQQYPPQYYYEPAEPGSPYTQQYYSQPYTKQQYDQDKYFLEQTNYGMAPVQFKAKPQTNGVAKPVQQTQQTQNQVITQQTQQNQNQVITQQTTQFRQTGSGPPVVTTQTQKQVIHRSSQDSAGSQAPQFVGKFQSVTINEGDSLRLYCKAVPDVQSMQWFRDGTPLSTGGNYKIEQKAPGESILLLSNAKLADGGWYQCDASNPSGTTSLKGRVVIQTRQKLDSPSPRERILLRKVDRTRHAETVQKSEGQQLPPSKEPPKFLSPIKSLSLSEGQHALLDCKFTPVDDPNLKIAWLLNGKALLASSRITTVADFGYAVLEINPVTVFDHGEYTVVAVNQLGEARQSAILDVHGYRSPSVNTFITHQYQDNKEFLAQQQQLVQQQQKQPQLLKLDKPNFHSELRSQELFEGQPLHLEIKLTPINDPTMTIEFYQNGNPIQPSDRINLQFQHGFVVLSINEANVQDGGYYVCRAINDIGVAETAATVIVHPRVDVLNVNKTMDVEDLREMQSSMILGQKQAPQFVSHLKDFHCEDELGRSYFEAKIAPINDPTLRVRWLKDGHDLPNANRIQTFHNFGFVSLTLHPTYPEDVGEYSCVLNNDLGEAISSAKLTTIAIDPLKLNALHEDSLQQINYIEGHEVHIGPILKERPEEFQSMETPRIARALVDRVEVQENEPVHFECRIQPASDVKMAVEWYHNGVPLPAAHRFRPMFDFGYVALDILYAYTEDSGTYTMVARNELGEVSTSVELNVQGQKSLYLDAQHPEGFDRIQELEQPKQFGLAEIADRGCDNPAKLLGELQNIELNENDDIHFDLKLTPVHDPTMVVEWFVNGHPLLTGSRVRTTYDFGFITLDIKGVIPEDSGEYVIRARNALGEDSKQCQVTIHGKDAVISGTQHEESVAKIQYLESLDKYGRPEVEEAGPTQGPSFVQGLPGDLGEIEEGAPLHLECKVEPVADNTLQVYWLRNGNPLPHAHRFRTFHDFGYVSLDILSVYAEDSGTFTCVAKNAVGEAQTSTQFISHPKSRIIGDTQHPTSVARIQELEAPKPLPEEAPEAEKQAPFFVRPLGDGQVLQANEADNLYLEAQFGPVDDNTLKFEWLLNDHPIMNSHRYVTTQDFGFASLNILYIYPEDSGIYTLVLRNSTGEARSSIEVQCEQKGGTMTESFHPSSIQRIIELESSRPAPEERPEEPKGAPQIVTPLPPSLDKIHETQTLHLEAQILPVNDPSLKIEWFHDGAPLKQSNRYRLINDFGYISLDIDFVLPHDAGEYTLVATNHDGQAQTSTRFEVIGHDVILTDTSHPESLRRIQEIEAIRPARPEEVDLAPEAPQFTQQLQGPTDVLKEGQSVHMDCTVQPINDPKLKIEWFHNGYPLKFSNRIRTIHDFGYVALEFLYVNSDDSGTYTCRASNEAGEATTSFDIEVKSKRNIYLDTQHEESWAKIQELENREVQREPSPELSFPPPTFTVPLQNADSLMEGDAVRLECRLIPVNDPTLKVFWTVNDHPLPEGSRFMPARNMDYVTLDILAVYGEDSGVYTCKAVSQFGEATTSCEVKCQATDALLLDTQHQESWNRIQEIESRLPEEYEAPEPEKVPPRFIVNLPQGLPEFQEGQPIHLEAQVEPTNDNELVIEWYRDGAPLSSGHRFKTVHAFGYVSLDILYSFAQDSGTYTCVARNSLGEATTDTTLQITGFGLIYTDSQHPNSWQKIQEIEAPKELQPEAEPEQHGAPQFLEPMESLERLEGQPAHFHTRVQPITDSKMVIQWLKDGHPLGNSNRMAFTTDFGYIALDIAHTRSDDAGTYTVVAKNEQGEAQVDAQLTVQAHGTILTDTQNESSWQKIQEIEAPRGPAEEAPEVEQGPPRFVQQLNSVTDLIEGQPAHFEAQIQPISDPNLRLQWFHNGKPLAAGSRIGMRNDFGLVSLDIHYVLSQDIGDYRCVATNNYGEDSTEGHLDCQKRPNIITDTLHDESWRRIQEIEAPREAAPEAPQAAFGPPQFTQPLQSLELLENSIAFFEAQVVPVNDPSLQIQWFLNDSPLGQSNRYAMSNDFGYVTLRINGVATHDQGVYSCKAVNNEGDAITSASLTVQGEDSLQLGTLHEESLAKIQHLESLDKYPRLEYPEQEFFKPNWTKTFENVEVDTEGAIIVLDGQVEPANDPNLKVEWFLNGHPLRNANRFRQDYNFGAVTLTIIHVFPQDSGVYSCRAYNDHGEATTSATVKVAGYEAIFRDTQHPESWEKIQELERPKIIEEVEVVEEKEKPRFLTQLESYTDVPEGTPIRLEATFQPARDSSLTVQWLLNGHPLGASQLIKTKAELGWAYLEISAVNLDHNGVYTLKIANTEGEAASSASIKVAGVGDILGETMHEESWRRIQEIEAPREPLPEPPPPEYDLPSIQVQIQDVEVEEGDPSRFEAVIQPVNDPNLQIQWIRNGHPLAHGSKYAITKDFGFCILDIGYTFPEDSGVYQLKIWNDKGEAVTSATLKCTGKDAIMGDVQHEASWQRIQAMEAPKLEAPEAPEKEKQPPKFTSPIQTPGDLIEGQPAHFETTVEPIDDPELVIQWFLNGAPIANSSRVKMINDFGWVILNINSTEERDTGEWVCVATNSLGEARNSTNLNVQGGENLLLQSINEQSFNRIQELEAPRVAPELPEVPPAEAPQISAQLVVPEKLEEGDSAHLEAQYTPTNDPKLRVEWYRDGNLIHHANRFKMVNDFGFAILDILYLLAQDAGEYTLRVVNESGEATTSGKIEIGTRSGLLLEPQDENKAKAVQELEDYLHRKPEEVEDTKEERTPVFVEPLSAPVQCESEERVHFSARYEPVDDNQLVIQWFLNGRPLITGSRVKTLNEFGYVVLEISPAYPEDSGEYTCKATNRVGSAVTSTTLTCTPKEGIILQSQLPQSMAGAQQRIDEIENRRPYREEAPEIEHGPPRFVTQLPNLQPLIEGSVVHLDVQVEPVADPKLRIEWFHNGNPIRNTSRMKAVHDFGYVVLELTPAEPQDTGTWTCRATNDYGTAEVSGELQITGDSGVLYEWVSPGERRERIEQLEEWINRPKDALEHAAQEFDAPRFTEQLQDLGELSETDAASFLCVLEPIGDPTMKIEWQHNGHAIPYSNRIQMSNDFGVISLMIKHLITQDSGEYQCIARNSKGEAVTTGKIVVQSITEIETPQIAQALIENVDALEGESVHLECRVTPINDPKLTVHWLRNGHPLPEANRFKTMFEFGFVTLDILYAYPEDNGDYELVVTNDKGQASTKAHVVVISRPNIEYGPQAPGSNVENIEQHLRQFTRAELKLSAEDAFDPNVQRPPEFKTPLVNIGVEEGDFCRFETQIAPINDPYLKVEWFKDQKPVLIGNRFRNTWEYGYACLDLLFALPDDTGEYTCVATNQFGQAMISAKLACSGKAHIITDSQLPQGMLVSDIKRDQDQLYWTDMNAEPQPRQKQAPQFTITPRNLQVVENQPARFECAVIGNPRPKVIWYINGNQALHGHRYKLHYDGIHYLTITHTRIADAGEILVIAKNSEGEVQSISNLDVFQSDDFRQHKLKHAVPVGEQELHDRHRQWQVETLGQLGEAFKQAPKPDVAKLFKVERAKSPIEPLESEELIGKFTRPKDEKYYEKLTYVEREQKQFEGLKLEQVSLKPGKVGRYVPPEEKMETVQLKGVPKPEETKIPKRLASPPLEWAAGQFALGKPVGKVTQKDAPPPEVNIPARDQVNLKTAKPKRDHSNEHVRIEESRAKVSTPKQAPPQPKEEFVPHKEQVSIKKQFKPKETKPGERFTIDTGTLRESEPIVKSEIEQTTIASKTTTLRYQVYREHAEPTEYEFEDLDIDTEESGVRRIQYDYSPRSREKIISYSMRRSPQPTKLGETKKAPPTMQTQLKPIQGELGRSARFSIAYSGDPPINVKWFHNGKELRSAFDTLIRTTEKESVLELTKLKQAHEGEYACRLGNVAGQVESSANLVIVQPSAKGVAPDFKQRLSDQRVQQNSTAVFKCAIVGQPRPTIRWFKDGKELPNDARYQMTDSDNETSLAIIDILPPDSGVYECVAKNTAGEARCKARLALILAKTGKAAEAGPRLEAPRFTTQIQPLIVEEGKAAEFRANYSGSPEPAIRWYRNNEPVKVNRSLQVGNANGEAWLRISDARQEHVAEYKCEANNPAGKATTVANLVLKPIAGRIAGTTGKGSGTSTTIVEAKSAPVSKVPQFLQKLSSINARQGENVKLVAEIDGDPQPTVTWVFNGRQLYGGRDHKITLVGNQAILEISRVSAANQGTYQVNIKNPNGTAQCEAKLNIQSR